MLISLGQTYKHDTGCLKKVLPNRAFGDPAASWEEILMIFKENLQMLNLVKLSFFDTLYNITIMIMMQMIMPHMIGTVKEFSFWNVTYSNNIVANNL